MQQATSRHVLLLTATVSPADGQPTLALRDPAERLAEYERALAFYQGLLAQGVLRAIVFGENSGYDLARLAARFPHPGIEWVALAPQERELRFHRGYAEFQLIDALFERSRVLSSLGDDALVWKVSGRYVVANLAALTRSAPRHVDFYVMADHQWVEMSVMAWSARGYRAIVRGLYAQFASQEPPELILRRHLGAPVRSDVKCVLSFRWPVRLFGRRGTDGSPYEGRRTRYRFALQAGWKSLCLPWRRWRDV
jgi:hypothetical protein